MKKHWGCGVNFCKILEVLVKIAKVQFYHTKKFNFLMKAGSRQWQNSTCILTKGVKVLCEEEQGEKSMVKGMEANENNKI